MCGGNHRHCSAGGGLGTNNSPCNLLGGGGGGDRKTADLSGFSPLPESNGGRVSVRKKDKELAAAAVAIISPVKLVAGHLRASDWSDWFEDLVRRTKRRRGAD